MEAHDVRREIKSEGLRERSRMKMRERGSRAERDSWVKIRERGSRAEKDSWAVRWEGEFNFVVVGENGGGK